MAISRYRFLAAGCSKHVVESVLPSARTWCHKINHRQSLRAVGFFCFARRSYSYTNVPLGRVTWLMMHEFKGVLSRSTGYRRVYLSSKDYRLPYHAQVAWRRLFDICSYNGSFLPPVIRIARAVSLALSRSHLVAPGIMAFIVGELAFNQGSCALAEYLPSKDTLYLHAQDGHVYMTSIAFSLLEGLILAFRAIYLAILFSPCILMAPFADYLGIDFRESWLHTVRVTLEKAGPAFIKWGQWAAARPDLFPIDLCDELSELHTKAPAHSFEYTKNTVEKAFGRRLTDMFENFDEVPVASGSIAQVHQATLKSKYPRQKVKPVLVAVKVRHPGVSEAIRRDFVLINLFAKVSTLIPTLKWLRLDESIQQFAVFMMSQVDLAREAANLSRFIYNFRRWKDVSFPKPVYPLVHPAVLVESYEHGENILNYIDRLEGHEHIRTALSHIGTHALLQMLLVDNFIHADMHPGNILVREVQGPSSATSLLKSKPHLVFLDVGMTAELSKRDRDNLMEFFKAVALRDGRAAAECTLKLANKQSCPSPQAFIQEVGDTFRYWGSDEGELIHPSDCMQQMLEHVRRHRVNIDGNICTVIVTTMVLEGWQRKLDPDYDVMHTLHSLLFKVDWVDSLLYTIGGIMAP